MAYDYSSLFATDDGVSGTWREIYDDSLSLPDNLINILRRTVYLPQNFYLITAAYFMMPSALCKVVPYLFLYGQSGSGKSTYARIASYLHGTSINGSNSTFAGIRNEIETNRNGVIRVQSDSDYVDTEQKEVERNTCLIWDDIDARLFLDDLNLYRLFKCGYDRSTDKIIISSRETGVNLEFHCFCPKIFSSISSLHLDDRFKELRRRLIVIPFKRVEDISSEILNSYSVSKANWQDNLIDDMAYDWKGFNELYSDYWDLNKANTFLSYRKLFSGSVPGLNSQQRIISLDLIATGLTCGIWLNLDVAIEDIKAYWQWFKQETEANAGLNGLLKEYIKQETKNAVVGGIELKIYTNQIRNQVQLWVNKGWLYETPRAKDVKEQMFDLGMRLQKGVWVKG